MRSGHSDEIMIWLLCIAILILIIGGRSIIHWGKYRRHARRGLKMHIHDNSELEF